MIRWILKLGVLLVAGTLARVLAAVCACTEQGALDFFNEVLDVVVDYDVLV